MITKIMAYLTIFAYICIGIGAPLALGSIVGGVVAESWILFVVLACIAGALIALGIGIDERKSDIADSIASYYQRHNNEETRTIQ